MKILVLGAFFLATGSVGVIAVADAVAEVVGGHTPIVEMTAMGSLIAALFFLLKVYLPKKDIQFIEAMEKKDERWERLEEGRKEDSRDLREVLGSMRDNCMATQASIRLENSRKQ